MPRPPRRGTPQGTPPFPIPTLIERPRGLLHPADPSPAAARDLLLPAVALALALCAAAFLASLCLGARPVPLASSWQALAAFDPQDIDQLVVRDQRLPRSLAGLAIGAGLAAAGAVMQALTRNPLADPGLLGVNGGAALAVVLWLWLFGLPPVALQLALAIGGAAAGTALVWWLGGRAAGHGRAGIARLALAGAALSALCLSITAALVLLSPETRALYRVWTVGALSGASLPRLGAVLPVLAAGLALLVALQRGIDGLGLGHDAARALGLAPGRVVGLAMAGVALLAGGTVALAGPVGFVGLVVPNLVRRLAGPALGRSLALCLPLGAALVLAADTLGRLVARPEEIPLGIVLALIGGPVFILLVGRSDRGGAR